MAKIKKVGVSSCNSKIKSSERDYFMNNFLQKYCGVFGRKVKFKRKSPAGLVNKISFISNVSVKSSQKKDIIKLMEQAASKKLKFVSKEGVGSLKAQMSGSYTFAQTDEKESDVHEYYVQEPYESVEEYTEEVSKEVPDCTRLKPNGMCDSKIVNETVVKLRPIVRYRSVKKYFPYKYILRKSSLDIDLNLALLGEGIIFKKQYKSQAKKHDYDIIEFKIKPAKGIIQLERDYINRILTNDIDNLVESAHQTWKRKYCTHQSSETYFTECSRAFLCHKVLCLHDYKQWFTKYYNLDLNNKVMNKFVTTRLM